MSELSFLTDALDRLGVSYTVRSDEGSVYSYLFFGEGDDAFCLTGLNDNFETTDLESLLCRHSFFEFENGKLVSYPNS